MADLQYRQNKIQEKRKQTPFRQFALEVASRFPLSFYRNGNISRFPNTSRQPKLIDQLKFAEGRNNLCEAGDKIDGNFFENFQQLFLSTQLPYTFSDESSENSIYSDGVAGAKNVYLSFSGAFMENVLYSLNAKTVTNCIASVAARDKSENIFECSGITKSYQCFYSHNIHDSSEIRFSVNLVGCSECIQCDGLINQSYHIGNKQYEKDEYYRLKEEIMRDKTDFTNRIPKGAFLSIKHGANNKHGNYLYNVKNSHNCFLVGGRQDKINLYDVIPGGALGDFYGVVNAGGNSQYLYNFLHGGEDYMCFYSYFLESCSYCLGCIGLINKQYCILNKQYAKEEWYEEVDRIFGKMEAEGILGNFFPGQLNPFFFNDTAAYLMDSSFTKEEVIKLGYMRRDEQIKVDIPEDNEAIKNTDLAQFESWKEGVWYIDPSILKKVIVDEQGNSYRIIKMEYDFLVKYGLPLPRKHWLERMKENFRIS